MKHITLLRAQGSQSDYGYEDVVYRKEYRCLAKVKSKPVQVFLADQLQTIDTVEIRCPYYRPMDKEVARWAVLMDGNVYQVTGKQINDERSARAREMKLTLQLDKKERDVKIVERATTN